LILQQSIASEENYAGPSFDHNNTSGQFLQDQEEQQR